MSLSLQTGPQKQVQSLPIDSIAANPYQPRKQFIEAQLEELAASIRQYGLLCPITVRRVGADGYELIAGERRLRACRMLRMSAVDAIVIPAFEQDSALIALIENLQRQDLHFLEEAEAFAAVIADHGMSQGELARRVGKSASAIANKLRLLKLPRAVKLTITEQALTERHARALLRLPDGYTQEHAVRRIVEMHMTVKETEGYIEQMLADGFENMDADYLIQKPKRQIKSVYRDHRIFVNAVLSTVKQLKAAGVTVESQVTEHDDCVEVLVTLPRIQQPGRGQVQGMLSDAL